MPCGNHQVLIGEAAGSRLPCTHVHVNSLFIVAKERKSGMDEAEERDRVRFITSIACTTIIVSNDITARF